MKQSGFAPVNDAELYYEVQGSGPPLLLIHAGVADSRMWQSQVEAFASRFTTIRFDMRGFGRSEVPPGPFRYGEDVAGLLDYLGVSQTAVVANSFGAQVAVDFALDYPEQVTALILGAPAVRGEEPSTRIRSFWTEEEEALERGDLQAAVELNLRLWVDGPQRQPQDVDASVRELVGEMQRRAFEIAVPDDVEETTPDESVLEQLAELHVPTLIIVGALDLEEKETLADDLVALMPDARKLVIQDAAHMMNMEKPQVFNRAVLSFLDRL